MKLIKMMGGDEYQVSDEDVSQLSGKSGLVYFPSLNGVINLNSVSSIMPINKAIRNRLPLHDGGFAVKKGSDWIDERSGSKIDTSYYPYLLKGMTKEEYEQAKLLN